MLATDSLKNDVNRITSLFLRNLNVLLKIILATS
jgi:hypothetical protein